MRDIRVVAGRAALALLLAVSLTGCETFGRFGRTEPTPAPPLVCPPSLAADITAEPLPPEGVDMSAIPPAVAAFLFGEWLPWSRGNTKRLDQGRTWCLSQSAQPR